MDEFLCAIGGVLEEHPDGKIPQHVVEAQGMVRNKEGKILEILTRDEMPQCPVQRLSDT